MTEIHRNINSGMAYLERIDESVRKHYKNDKANTMESCKTVIDDLQLPQAYINPLVNNAFMSHLNIN